MYTRLYKFIPVLVLITVFFSCQSDSKNGNSTIDSATQTEFETALNQFSQAFEVGKANWEGIEEMKILDKGPCTFSFRIKSPDYTRVWKLNMMNVDRRRMAPFEDNNGIPGAKFGSKEGQKAFEVSENGGAFRKINEFQFQFGSRLDTEEAIFAFVGLIRACQGGFEHEKHLNQN